MLFMLTNIPFPLFNAVMETHIAPDQVEERIDDVMNQARRRSVPLIWFITSTTQPASVAAHLDARGFFAAGEAIGMAADLHTLNENSLEPDDLFIEEVNDAPLFRVWCDILGTVNEFPDFATEAWFQIHSAMGLGPEQPTRHYLGRSSGIPVATSSLFLGPETASVASVATLTDRRQHGIGTAMTLEPLREARRMGYNVSTLCSSEMGRGVYERLGFREYCRIAMYCWLGD
jgi:predicted GNAT family acetyltransferase